jgi:hypothetical protein
MFELIDTRPEISVQGAEYQRLLGYPRQHELEGRALELASWARQWYAEHGRPWVYARETGGFEIATENLRINGTVFSSRQLRDQFSAVQAHDAMLVAVSAGPQCEEKARELWQEGKPDEYFFLEMYGSAVVEHLIATTAGRICARAEQTGLAVLPHYSPGYSGWDVSDQVRLWELIRRNNIRDFPGELRVLNTGMLQPKKSLLGVFGLTRHVEQARRFARLIPCESCSLHPCQYRRVPYQHNLPQVEEVRRLQGRAPVDPETNGVTAPALDHHAKYSVKPRALQKWSQERLQLKTLNGGLMAARFCYEGTTCSNLGHFLTYDYHVKLGPARDGYRILEASCAPAPGDTGHASQCEYLNDAEQFGRNVQSEKPLLGRPLNDVLNWERPCNPAGCYCDPASRQHKWGLVFEVIHYALVQREIATAGNGQKNGFSESARSKMTL